MEEGDEMDDAGGMVLQRDEVGMLFVDEVDESPPGSLGIGLTMRTEAEVLPEEAGVLGGAARADSVLDIGQ